MPASSRTRRSRYLFQLESVDGLDTNMLPIIRSGQTPAFTRGGTAGAAGALDQALRQYAVSSITPRVQWVTDQQTGLAMPAWLFEAAATNVVLRNRDLANAAWTKTNVTAVKDQTGIDGVASSASKITATAGNGTCLQAIVLGSSVRWQTAYVKRVTGSGTINMTMDNGATWTAITVTSSWARVSIPTQTLANPTVGFRIVTNGDAIAVDFVQNETGLAASSAIPTTTASVTRSEDVVSAAFKPIPQAMTVYVKFVDLGTQAVSGAVIDIGGNNSTPRFIMYGTAATGWSANHSGTVVASVASVATLNDTVELRGVLNADGSALIGCSKNGAAETTGSDATTRTLPSAWNSANLYPNHYTTTNIGLAGYISIRIAAGVQTLDTMRLG